MKFKNLQKSIKFGKKMVSENRLYYSSVGFDLCDKEGRPLPEFFEIYKSIMKGGCGFGFLGNSSVDSESQYTDRSSKLTSEHHAYDLKPLFDYSRNLNKPLVMQLQHYGAVSSSHVGADSALRGNVTHLSTEEIEQYINHFVEGAQLSALIGAEAIQIHAANGYLISSFLSPATNYRSDEWGGTPLKRARILLEIIKRIRLKIGSDITIFVRLQIDDGLGVDGLYVDLLSEVVVAIQEAGADAITCATGVSSTFSKFLADREHSLNVSREASIFIKKRVHIPIGFAANIDSLDLAEDIVSSGDADFIGFGRAIVADHDFVSKEISGNPELVNRCRWDSYCLRDKKEPLAERVYCCVNKAYLRPRIIQNIYQESL